MSPLGSSAVDPTRASLVGALLRAVESDPARPRLTWYDDASGERVELSGATLLTWVAKTTHLLEGELGLRPGATADVRLPRHWTLAVWWLALDAVGAETVGGGGERDAPADLAVVGPDGWLDVDAHEVVAVSLLPLGAPFTDPLPALVHDFAAAVRGQRDRHPFTDARARATAVGRRSAATAEAWALAPTDRVLVGERADAAATPDAAGGAAGDPACEAACDPACDPATDLGAALWADASVVWLRNPRRPPDVERLVAEQVTAWVAPTGPQEPAWAEGLRRLPPSSVS